MPESGQEPGTVWMEPHHNTNLRREIRMTIREALSIGVNTQSHINSSLMLRKLAAVESINSILTATATTKPLPMTDANACYDGIQQESKEYTVALVDD